VSTTAQVSDTSAQFLTRQHTSWRHRLWLIALVLGSYLVLSLFLFWPLITRGLTTSLPPGTDAQALTWMYSWLPFALTHLHNPFVTNYVSYPAGVNLLSNTSIMTMTFFTWPITALFGPVASFNLTGLFSPVFSAGAMYLLCSRFTTHRWIAWVGGLAFGFSPYMITALGHLQLCFVPCVPLLFLAMYELLTSQRPRAEWLGVGLAAVIILQFFASTEIAVTLIMCAIGTVLVALPFVWTHVMTTWRYIAKTLIVGAGASFAVLIIPFYYIVAGPLHVTGLVNTTQFYRTDLAGPLYPSGIQLFAPQYFKTIANQFSPGENYAYLGLPLVLLVLAGVIILRKNRVVVISFVVASIAFIMSLGGGLVITAVPNVVPGTNHAVGLWVPERLFESQAFFENIIPSRLMMFTFLFVDIILVLVLQAIVASSNRRIRGTLVAIAVALLCLVPQIPRLPINNVGHAAAVETPSGVTELTRSFIPNDDSVVTYPYPAATLDALLWQGDMDMPFKMPAAWFRVPASTSDSTSALDPVYFYGTTSTTGETFVLLQKGTPVTMSEQLRSSILDELKGWKVHWVLASCDTASASTDRAYQSTNLGVLPLCNRSSATIVRSYLTQLFGPPSHASSGAYLWHIASS